MRDLRHPTAAAEMGMHLSSGVYDESAAVRERDASGQGEGL